LINATMRTSNIDSKTHEPAYDAAAGSTSHSSDLDVIDSPREYDPALGLERSLSRRYIQAQTTYRVYKRRFFGLAQLVLLNIIVSWDWLSFSPVSKTSAEYFETSETAINWLSTSFLFSFCVASPFTIYALNKAGPRGAIIVASCLILGGNWARYGGTRGGDFGAVMFGQILIGLAQPFVLSAPTRYSDVWFSDKGRVSATAVASLANPLGGALAQLIDPFWAAETSEIPNMVLYISIIVRTLSKPTSSNQPLLKSHQSTVACMPSFFVPSAPPTPPSASAASRPQTRTHTNRSTPSLFTTLKLLMSSPANLLLILPFWAYVSLFNSLSSLLNQILYPYSYTETQSGIAGALLILVGLLSAALSSPLIDRYKSYLLYIKIAVPVIAICYLLFIWAPESRTLVYPYLLLSLLGAACFGLVPLVLEFLVEISWPLPPEVGSTVCWTGGQLFGGIFIIVENALKAAEEAEPPLNMRRALVFQAVVALVVMPLPLWLGLKGARTVRRRLEVDKGNTEGYEGAEPDPHLWSET
jgi:MFS family permease